MQQPSAPVRRLPHPLVSLGLLVSFFFLGQVVGGIVGVLAAMPFLSGGPFAAMQQLQQILNNDFRVPNAWAVMMIVQGFSSLGGFVLAAWAYLRFMENRSLRSLNTGPGLRLVPAALVLGLGLAFIFFNEWIYQWNRNWDLPDWLGGFEAWSRSQQEKLNGLTRFLTDFDTFGKMLVALLVIAVLPAVGEELLFRGTMQPVLFRWTGNAHAAVWVTGFIFSFIHFQLDGFVPRWLLGVVFGYLYVWSGNIWYPIWGHFVNNGGQVLGLYLSRTKTTDIDLENTEWITTTQGLAAFAISAVLLWAVNRSLRPHPGPPQGEGEK
jgi:hypothetical protein